jgi:hypothetical protein
MIRITAGSSTKLRLRQQLNNPQVHVPERHNSVPLISWPPSREGKRVTLRNIVASVGLFQITPEDVKPYRYMAGPKLFLATCRHFRHIHMKRELTNVVPCCIDEREWVSALDRRSQEQKTSGCRLRPAAVRGEILTAWSRRDRLRHLC